MKTIAVYRIVNTVTGETYIGSSVDIDNRLTTHKLARDKTALHEAIRKYGWENFRHEVVAKPDFGNLTKEEVRQKLPVLEQYWLDIGRQHGGGQYNTFTKAGRNSR